MDIDRHPEWKGLWADGKPDLFHGKTPNPSQLAWLNFPYKYAMWGGKVRDGKTVGLCWRLAYLAFTWPNNLIVLGRWYKEHLYDSTLDTFMRCFPPSDYPIVYEGGKETDCARFPNGSVIKFVPLSDRKRWPGQEIGAFGIDQAEQCTRQTWTDLMRRLCRMEVPKHSHCGLGTSNFEGNWDWAREMFVDKRGIEPGTAHHFGYYENTANDNDCHIPDGYRDEQIGVLSPHEADRLIRGIDVRNIGHVYKKWDESNHVRPFELDDIGHSRYLVSYDYGRGHPTAILLGAVDKDGRHWIRAEHYETEMDVPEHEMLVERLALKVAFPLEQAIFPAGWDIFNKQQSGHCIADEWSNRFKWFSYGHGPGCVAARIERVAALLDDMTDGKPGLVVHPDCVNLRYEMSRYKYCENGSGRPAPETETYRSDACDALGGLCVASSTPGAAPLPRSSVLTPDSYQAMVHSRRNTGRACGFWVPVQGGVDPASVPRRRGPRPY